MRKNKVRNPDLAFQIRQGNGISILIDGLKRFNLVIKLMRLAAAACGCKYNHQT
jgi:hypothetical protein